MNDISIGLENVFEPQKVYELMLDGQAYLYDQDELKLKAPGIFLIYHDMEGPQYRLIYKVVKITAKGYTAPKTNDNKIDDEGKWINIKQRQADGSWKTLLIFGTAFYLLLRQVYKHLPYM